MANGILGGIGQGLRIAGGALSPQAFRQEGIQRENIRGIEANKSSQARAILINAIMQGAINPDSPEAQKVIAGMGLPRIGKSAQAQNLEFQQTKYADEQFEAEREKATDVTIRDHVAKIYSDSTISEEEKPLRAAEAYALAGRKDESTAYANIAKARASKEPKDIKPQFVELNVGIDPQSGKPLSQKHWVKGVLPSGELDLVPLKEPGVKGAITEVTVNQGQSPTDAAKTELLAQGILDMKEYNILLKNPDGSVNRTLVAQLNVPGFAGVPGTKSRDAFSLLHNAVEAKLRAESGAAVPETEVKRIAERFFPSVLDKDETIVNKQRRLNAFLEGTFRRIKGKQQIIDSEGNIYEFDNRSGPETQGTRSPIPKEIQEIDDELEAIKRELNG